MKQMLFIVNPRSGKAQIKNHLLDILDIFIKGGYNVRVHVTQRPQDATEAVKQLSEDVELLVCSGGDGTLSETISGMVAIKEPPVLGYIPAGSTNDFAASIHISNDMTKAARDILNGTPYPIDIGCFCKDRHFVYIAAFGAFTGVSYMTPQEKKNFLGHQAYMLEGVKSLISLKSYKMKVEAEDFILEGEFIFGMVTNTISVGGFKGLVTQDVALNDGVFEVLLIRTPKTPIDFSNIISYMFLKEEVNEYVHKFKTNYLRLTSEEPVDWVLDGEFGGTRTEVEIQNLQKKIEIIRHETQKK